jgi:hypothetical protein
MIKTALAIGFGVVLVAGGLGCGAHSERCRGDDCPAGDGDAGAEPQCDPGAVEDCYSGPAGTEGVGPCTGGTRECSASGFWGPCLGEVVPRTEVCNSGIDEDCNGLVDDVQDHDGDGWTPCDGDCCDIPGPDCADPFLVNPGAFEVAGNGVDDNCDGMVDVVLPLCDGALASDASDPMLYAQAMDLCQVTTEDAPLPERRWGVISAELTLADGTGAPAAVSRSIRSGFGATSPQLGQSFAVLSTGHAAAPGQTNPAFASFQTGVNTGTSSGLPADFAAAHGGSVPNAPGCPAAQNGATAFNPVMLTLRIRVPTNARSFSFSSNFFSAEYPEFVCSPFNDFFVALLDSEYDGDPPNPPDKNLAVYTAPDAATYPVGVNLAFGDTGLFSQCKNGPTGCATLIGAIPGATTSCLGTDELTGTGFDVVKPNTPGPAPGWCDDNDLLGGGTGWLVTRGNVVPGEIITLRIAIWDTGDGAWDSVVLLDNFQWSVEASEPGTDIIIL